MIDGQLRSIVERIERLEADKAELAADIRDVYLEAKSHGFTPKILRKVIALRKMDPAKRQEEAAMVDLYLSGLGMQDSFDFAPPRGGDGEKGAGDGSGLSGAGKAAVPSPAVTAGVRGELN